MTEYRHEEYVEQRSTLQQIIKIALSHLKDDDREWLKNSIQESNSIDHVISSMRHVEGGQLSILEELKKIDPGLSWFRGGTATRWSEMITENNHQLYSQKELDTFVIDGGANGAMGRSELALAFTMLTKREKPVIYQLTIDALINGIKNKQIRLVSEHSYDLRVISNDNHKAYIDFCKKHLDIRFLN